jgi:hypothetical protein
MLDLACSSHRFPATNGFALLEAIVSLLLVSIALAGLFQSSLYIARTLRSGAPLEKVHCKSIRCGDQFEPAAAPTSFHKITCQCNSPLQAEEWHVVK